MTIMNACLLLSLQRVTHKDKAINCVHYESVIARDQSKFVRFRVIFVTGWQTITGIVLYSKLVSYASLNSVQ